MKASLSNFPTWLRGFNFLAWECLKYSAVTSLVNEVNQQMIDYNAVRRTAPTILGLLNTKLCKLECLKSNN